MSGKNDMQYDVFISASSADVGVADSLHDALLRHGLKVFYSPGANKDNTKDSMQLGASIVDSISSAMASARFMVCLLSTATKQSGWVAAEIDMRLTADHATHKTTLVPVYLDTASKADWKDRLSSLHSHWLTDADGIENLATRLIGEFGKPIEPEQHIDGQHRNTLSDLLRSAEREQLDAVFDDVRLELARSLSKTVNDMVTQEHCRLPMTVYYAAVGDVLRRVKPQGRVSVTNVLWHNEWEEPEFSRTYLNQETNLIRDNRIHVQRFFIGEAEHFDKPGVRELVRRNRKAGVEVRCLYVKNSDRQDYDQDIGIYDTHPESYIEGHHKSGFLMAGTVGLAQSRYGHLLETFR